MKTNFLSILFLSFDILALDTRSSTDEKVRNAIAETCEGRKCTIDLQHIDVDNNVPINFGLTVRGSVVKCTPDKSSIKKPGIWHGVCENGGDANMIKYNEKIYGSIHAAGQICRLGPDSNGAEVMECVPESEYPDEAEPKGHRMLKNTLRLRGEDNPIDLLSTNTTEIAEITVLVVWTKKAECLNSGLDAICFCTNQTEANMRGLIDLAVAETNTAYDRSGVFIQLRLVHAYRDEEYSEPSNISQTLLQLILKRDGRLDDVHRKRYEYAADIVALIVHDDYYCGVAYSGPGKNCMFSVTRWSCATGYYSFGHEIGHNLGCQHDRGTANACSSPGCSFGYRDPDANFRSILAYNCRSGQCDDNSGQDGCPRVQMFSNPNNKYNGESIGNAKNDNRRQMNDNRFIVAGYLGNEYDAKNAPTRSQAPTTMEGKFSTFRAWSTKRSRGRS